MLFRQQIYMSSRNPDITGPRQLSLVPSMSCEVLKNMAWWVTKTDVISTHIQSLVIENGISRIKISCNDNLILEFVEPSSILRNVIKCDNNGLDWTESFIRNPVGNFLAYSVHCMVIPCFSEIYVSARVIHINVEWYKQWII